MDPSHGHKVPRVLLYSSHLPASPCLIDLGEHHARNVIPQNVLTLSRKVDECAPLPLVRRREGRGGEVRVARAVLRPGAYTRPRFGSTSAHVVGYVGRMIFPQSI